MGVAENKKVVQSFIECVVKGNIEGAMDSFADDATWWLPGTLPLSGTYKGKKAILEDFFGRSQPLLVPNSLSLDIKNVIGEGDCVVVEWIARAETVKGRNYENYYNLVFEIKNNKIQAVREYVDTLYAKEVVFS